MNADRPDLAAIVQMVPERARVLDLGCGDGSLLAELITRKSVVGRGVEVDEVNVRACLAKGLSVRHGNIEDGLADFPDGMFDVVILSQTIAYLNRPLLVLREMARVGGTVIVSAENAGHWRVRWRALRGLGGGNTLASGLPRVRSITFPQFLEAIRQLDLGAEERIFMTGLKRVRWWPTLRAEGYVLSLAKAGSSKKEVCDV